MTFTDIFEELTTIYDEAWFNDAYKKFKNHPSNINQEGSFSITIVIDDNTNERTEKVINFEDFVMGIRDEVCDSIYDSLENDKFIAVGQYKNGFPKYGLPDGVVYNPSSNFYPNPALNIWQKKLTSKINKSLSLITTLAEKELFLNALAAIIKEYKGLIGGTTLRSSILLNILNKVNLYISKLVGKISELNTFVEDYNGKFPVLDFNLDQASLAKLIKLLFEKSILDNSVTSSNEILEWFSRNSLVKSRTSKKILPKTLNAEFRRLSTNRDINLTDWFNVLN